MRKYLCAALSPQTCKKCMRTALPPQTHENDCALRSRRKDAKTPAHCAPAANLQKAPAHRKCRECFRRTVLDCPNERAAYFADILQHFCKMSAKYGERLGAITQGEDLTNGTLRCAGFLYFFALCGMALQRAAHGKCLQPADAICIAISRGTCGAQAYVHLRSCVVSLRRTLSPPTAYL